jgi:hypothetical protein
MLSQKQQKIYESINKKVRSYGDAVKLPFAHANEIHMAFEALLLDNPEIFYMDAYQCSKDLNKQTIMLKPEYKYPTREMRQHQETIESSLTFIEAVKHKSDYEKVLYVHDIISENVRYDHTFSDTSSSVLGVARNRAAVCEGIAKYVKLALDCLSVKSVVVVGHAINPAFDQSAAEPHAWNMVEINGGWYHLDVTFDLTLKHKSNRYDYFLVKDEDIKIDHSTANKLPPTAIKPMDYYYTKGLAVAKSFDLEQLIHDGLLNGQRVMQFRLLNVREGLNPSDKVLKVAEEQCQRILNRSFSVEVRYNSVLWIFELEII